MPRDQPSDGGGGFANPTTFNTIEEARAHQVKVAKLNKFLQEMTPADRAEWFAINGDNIDDALESIT